MWQKKCTDASVFLELSAISSVADSGRAFEGILS